MCFLHCLFRAFLKPALRINDSVSFGDFMEEFLITFKNKSPLPRLSVFSVG